MQRLRDFGTVSVNRKSSSNSPFPGYRELWKRKWKGSEPERIGNQQNNVFQIQQDWCICAKRLVVCTDSSQMRLPKLMEGQRLSPRWCSCVQLTPTCKGKILFSSGVSLGILATLKNRPCGGLNRKDSYRLMCLNAWSTGYGTVRRSCWSKCVIVVAGFAVSEISHIRPTVAFSSAACTSGYTTLTLLQHHVSLCAAMPPDKQIMD